MGSDVLPANGDPVMGRYRLTDTAGTGGTARVWQARDIVGGRDVAVKIFDAGSEAAGAAAREAWAAGRLSHPGLPRLLDRGRAAGRHCLVWELIDGASAGELAGAGARLDDASIARVAVQLASALTHVHAHDISHGDVKPANVLFHGNGTVRLIDFGVCGRSGADQEGADIAGVAAVAAALADPNRLASPILRALIRGGDTSRPQSAREFGRNVVAAARTVGIRGDTLGYAAAAPGGVVSQGRERRRIRPRRRMAERH